VWPVRPVRLGAKGGCVDIEAVYLSGKMQIGEGVTKCGRSMLEYSVRIGDLAK
jgi:hypothetical protein